MLGGGFTSELSPGGSWIPCRTGWRTRARGGLGPRLGGACGGSLGRLWRRPRGRRCCQSRLLLGVVVSVDDKAGDGLVYLLSSIEAMAASLNSLESILRFL